jgi:hypothetical protein
MRTLFNIASALIVSIILTAITYFINTGCSCGPALGLPFSYVHPLIGCTTGMFVLGADPNNRFGPVFDIGSVIFDIIFWGALAYYFIRRFRIPRNKNIDSISES